MAYTQVLNLVHMHTCPISDVLLTEFRSRLRKLNVTHPSIVNPVMTVRKDNRIYAPICFAVSF